MINLRYSYILKKDFQDKNSSSKNNFNDNKNNKEKLMKNQDAFLRILENTNDEIYTEKSNELIEKIDEYFKKICK